MYLLYCRAAPCAHDPPTFQICYLHRSLRCTHTYTHTQSRRSAYAGLCFLHMLTCWKSTCRRGFMAGSCVYRGKSSPIYSNVRESLRACAFMVRSLEPPSTYPAPEFLHPGWLGFGWAGRSSALGYTVLPSTTQLRRAKETGNEATTKNQEEAGSEGEMNTVNLFVEELHTGNSHSFDVSLSYLCGAPQAGQHNENEKHQCRCSCATQARFLSIDLILPNAG